MRAAVFCSATYVRARPDGLRLCTDGLLLAMADGSGMLQAMTGELTTVNVA